MYNIYIFKRRVNFRHSFIRHGQAMRLQSYWKWILWILSFSKVFLNGNGSIIHMMVFKLFSKVLEFLSCSERQGSGG